MNTKLRFPSLAVALTLAAALPLTAHATPAPQNQSGSQTQSGVSSPAKKDASQNGRASLRIDVNAKHVFVGQAVPVTVTAMFRGIEGATLEGTPQLSSKSVVTFDLGHDAHQSNEMVGGERVLIVRWTGTVTPSSAGPLDLKAELPVSIRYREAAPQPARQAPQADPRQMFDVDPFAGFGGLGGGFGPDDDLFDRMQQQMMRQMEAPVGRLREESVPLAATNPTIDVRRLPTANQPASFSGAVGQFEISSSASSRKVSVSEPVTVRISVTGSVDLDRVDVPAIASSEAWKAYPPRALNEDPKSKGAPHKVFEQVLVPLHGGDLTVPAVTFSAFDPTNESYVTKSTAPIPVFVDGPLTPVAAVSIPSTNGPAPSVTAPPSASLAPDYEPVSVSGPVHIARRVLPVLALIAIAAIVKLMRRKRGEWSLRHAMRRAASKGNVPAFLTSAQRLIAKHLSDRWHVPPEAITARVVEERLGARGESLAEVLRARETLRFGRGDLDETSAGNTRSELGALSSSIEQSLRGAT